MSFIRKLIIVLVGISLGALVTALLLNPESIIRLATSLETTSMLIRLPLVILIDVVILAIIVVLIRSERQPRADDALIVKAQGVHADVSIDSARERLLRAVREVPGVVSAKADIKAVRGKADVDLDVVVFRESHSLPEKQKEIERALRQVLNKQLGLQLAGKPRVHIRIEDEAALVASAAVLAAPASVEPTPVPAATPVEAPPVVVEEPAAPEPVLVQETAAEIASAPPPDEPVFYAGPPSSNGGEEEKAKSDAPDSSVMG